MSNLPAKWTTIDYALRDQIEVGDCFQARIDPDELLSYPDWTDIAVKILKNEMIVVCIALDLYDDCPFVIPEAKARGTPWSLIDVCPENGLFLTVSNDMQIRVFVPPLLPWNVFEDIIL